MKIIYLFLFFSFLYLLYYTLLPKNYIHENEIYEWVKKYIAVVIQDITEKYKTKYYDIHMVTNQDSYLSKQKVFVEFLSKEITERLKKYHSRDKIIQAIRDSFEFNFNYFIFPDSLLQKANVNYYREIVTNIIGGKNKSLSYQNDRDYKIFLENLI